MLDNLQQLKGLCSFRQRLIRTLSFGGYIDKKSWPPKRAGNLHGGQHGCRNGLSSCAYDLSRYGCAFSYQLLHRSDDKVRSLFDTQLVCVDQDVVQHWVRPIDTIEAFQVIG